MQHLLEVCQREAGARVRFTGKFPWSVTVRIKLTSARIIITASFESSSVASFAGMAMTWLPYRRRRR